MVWGRVFGSGIIGWTPLTGLGGGGSKSLVRNKEKV